MNHGHKDTMLRVRNLSNKYQKRLIRPQYAQTQATPYAAILDESLRNTDGSFRKPANGDSNPTRSADAYTLKNGLVPATVMINAGGDKVKVASGANVAEQPFGLLANFVGGELDDLGDEDYVGVWRGPDATFEILAPGFNDTGLSAAYAAATPGSPVKLYAGADGRLTSTSPGGSAIVVAHLLERVSASRIVIDLKV
jgi:hypothetical protein